MAANVDPFRGVAPIRKVAPFAAARRADSMASSTSATRSASDLRMPSKTVDTTGFTTGSWTLNLNDTLNGPTAFAPTATTITDGLIVIEDKGALDCVVRARVETAVSRGVAVWTADWSALS